MADMLNRSDCRNFIGRAVLISGICIFIFLWSGCRTDAPAPHPAEPFVNPAELVREAENCLDVIRILDLDASFQPDVVNAERLFAESKALQKEGKNRESFDRADACIKTAQNILRRFYRETIGKLAQEVRNELDAILEDDPENPAKKERSSLSRIIEYADALQDDRQAVALNRVLADLEEVVSLSKNIRAGAAVTLASDISFTAGDFDLSDQGREMLDAFLNDMLSDLEIQEGMRVRIKVKVVGFTDALNFGARSRFVKKIAAAGQYQIPDGEPARRQFLNQLLSEHRARSIAEYIRQYAERAAGPGSHFEVAADVSGRGEEIPAGVPPPYPTPDDRRRICKIYVHASIQ